MIGRMNSIFDVENAKTIIVLLPHFSLSLSKYSIELIIFSGLQLGRLGIGNVGFLKFSYKNIGKYNYRKSSIRSRPLIQVYSIRGRVIGGSVQALIIGKILNPSKIPYLDHY